MSEDSDGTLYATPDQKRFYKIPANAELGPGDLVLRSLQGGKIETTLAAVAKYELPEEDAKREAEATLNDLALRLGRFASGASSVLREVALRQKTGFRATTPVREQTLANALGLTPDQLKNDSKAVGRALREVARGFTETISQKGTEMDREAAKKRLEDLTALARRELGDEAGDVLSKLPEQLKKAFSNPKVAADIRRTTEQMKEQTAELRRQSQALRRTAADLVDRPERSEE